MKRPSLPPVTPLASLGLAASLLLGLAPAARAEMAAAGHEPMVLLPNAHAVQYGPGPASLPRGVRLASLAGDPAKPGPFVLRVIIPPHTVIAPHTHSAAENLTVISGAMFHEMGPRFERSRGQKVAAGGFVYLPGGMPHTVWTEGAPAELQVTGLGPFGVQYLNPADDPSRH